jgi:hypothetical protein
LTDKVPPITALPVVERVFNVVAELTDKEEPRPVFPVTLRTPLIPVLVKEETPLTLSDPKLAAELTLSDPPIPVFPEVERVFRTELPVTFKLPRFAREVTDRDAPIPVFPVTFKTPLIPVLANEETPLTFKLPRLAAEPTVRDRPMPAFPVTERDEPTPRKFETYPLPLTSKVYWGFEKPNPNLLLAKSK